MFLTEHREKIMKPTILSGILDWTELKRHWVN